MDPLLATALEAAEAAAQVHLRHFGAVGLDGAKEKAQSDFVSAADLEAQEAALKVIRARYPHHQILAEEETSEGAERSGPEKGGSERQTEGLGNRARGSEGSDTLVWVVDPLDGTTNYLHGHPQFAASVGVWRRRWDPEPAGDPLPRLLPEAGAVVAPRTGERWWARRGRGAFKNGLPLRVSSLRSLDRALVGTGFPFKEPGLLLRYLSQFQRVLPASGGIRRAGSAAVDLCYLAEGILDAFWEEEYLSPWDVAAGLVILQEAGGVATRIDDSAVDLEVGSVLAANSEDLHESLGRLIRGP